MSLLAGESLDVHIFSDASQRASGYAGAFIVGEGGEPQHVRHDCETSCQAEILTLIEAIKCAAVSHPPESLVVHTDLEGIHGLLDRSKRTDRQPALTLAAFRDMGVRI